MAAEIGVPGKHIHCNLTCLKIAHCLVLQRVGLSTKVEHFEPLFVCQSLDASGLQEY